MFTRLFATSGLSLDRLRSLVEVGAAGSIVRASGGEPVRQSQYSRQIKELEDFFQTQLIERHGRGIRLTAQGKELARISRFFLLGLSNFQRGCLTEEQTFCIGASATAVHGILLPVLAERQRCGGGTHYVFEVAGDLEAERRLHDLTLDFAVVTRGQLSRPLRLEDLGEWGVQLWVARSLHQDERGARSALQAGRLPLALPTPELPAAPPGLLQKIQPALICTNFMEARRALEEQGLATVLPDFLRPVGPAGPFVRVRWPELDSLRFHYRLAWNPRLLRLNPHAVKQRDYLLAALRSCVKRLTPAQRSPVPR